MMTQEKLEKAKEDKEKELMQECTFHPRLANNEKNSTTTLVASKSYQNL